MLGTNFPYYGFYVNSIETTRDEFMVPTQADAYTVTLKSMAATIEMNINPEKLVKDMQIMNEIRTSSDPAVRDAYEQILTVMALTKGRQVPDYGDECDPLLK